MGTVPRGTGQLNAIGRTVLKPNTGMSIAQSEMAAGVRCFIMKLGLEGMEGFGIDSPAVIPDGNAQLIAGPGRTDKKDGILLPGGQTVEEGVFYQRLENHLHDRYLLNGGRNAVNRGDGGISPGLLDADIGPDDLNFFLQGGRSTTLDAVAQDFTTQTVAETAVLLSPFSAEARISSNVL